jgi:hypothetical protein
VTDTEPRRIPHLIPGITVTYGWRQFIVTSITEDDGRVVLELTSTGGAENALAARVTRTREARRP